MCVGRAALHINYVNVIEAPPVVTSEKLQSAQTIYIWIDSNRLGYWAAHRVWTAVCLTLLGQLIGYALIRWHRPIFAVIRDPSENLCLTAPGWAEEYISRGDFRGGILASYFVASERGKTHTAKHGGLETQPARSRDCPGDMFARAHASFPRLYVLQPPPSALSSLSQGQT